MKLTVFFLFCLCYSESYKILVSYPFPVRSLSILGQGVVRHLLNDGHEVTYITKFPLNIPQNKNFRQIYITGNNLVDHFNIGNVLKNKIIQTRVSSMQKFGRETAKLFFENENVTKLLQNTNEHFDLVISDLIESEVYAGLAVLYSCPMIWGYSMGAHWQVLRLLSDTAHPAYEIDFLGTNFPPFTFTQRVQKLWSRIVWSFLKTFVTLPKEREIYEHTFKPLLAKRGRNLPDYEEVIFNSSLIFGNEHHAIIGRPNTPQNFKDIGGFHIDDPVVPLPQNLQNLMDKAPHGVIYFSMGSFWKSKMLPVELTKALISLFGELKETVIWKYEENLTDLPKNVHIVHWAPQQSILAHSNCKLFISHGGLLSSLEAIHFGVPVIGIPVIYDQNVNIIKAVHNGYAIKVDFNYDLPQNLKAAVSMMVNDKTYRKKAKKLSMTYHDRLTKPGAEFVYWVNHVIRTRGALHLRSPALNSPLYQRLYLDLIALILLTPLVIYSFLSMVFNRKNKNISKKKKY